jgi:hypothetical protein
MRDSALRQQLTTLLSWEDAHVSFERAVEGIAPRHRGERPANVPYSAWEILEHLRITQRDILEFCRNPQYEEMTWPDDYWPTSPTPPTESAWDDSIRQYRDDRKALQELAVDSRVDLFAKIPHGDGQTYLRELVLVADHGAYHVGELVVLRRILGIWPSRT